MHIVKVVKNHKNVEMTLYDDNLTSIESEVFHDTYALNFYLQTIQKKYNIDRGLLVIHDKMTNNLDITLSKNSNPFFIS